MSKILANQIANYGDDAPIEIKEGLNIPTGKPIQAAGSAGTNGQVLTSTGTSIQWTTPFNGDYNALANLPTIPAAQVASDWNATSGVTRILNKPVVPAQPSVVTASASGGGALAYNSGNGQFTYTPPDLASYAQTANLNTENWDAAFGWGDHASAGYLTAEADTLNTVTGRGATTTNNITVGQLTAGGLTYPTSSGTLGQVLTSDGAGNVVWGASSGGGGIALTDLSVTTTAAGTAALTYNNLTGVFTYTPPNLSGYLTSYTETDPVFSISPAAGITSGKITNWDTAYAWGDHTTAGYLGSQATNVVIGDATTGDAITTGDQNVVIGQGAGSAFTNKTNNVFVGARAGAADIGSFNIAIGPDAGDTSYGEIANVENVALGRSAGNIRNGNGNIGIGQQALSSTATSAFSFGNVALGYQAMGNSRINGASYNTSIGQQAGFNLSSGDANILIGDYAAFGMTTGSNNVIIGAQAGDDITTGNNNVIINGGNYQNGTTSGFTATTSNSLWIGHSSYAWITGASSGTTRTVTIPGQLTAGGLTYPTSNGTSGQVLTSDGAGNVTWGAGGGGANVTISDTAPGSPTAGDLWWESDRGRLKIYYQDVDSQQWVDASPPLAQPNVPVAAGYINMNGSSPTWTGTSGYTVAHSGGGGLDELYTLTFPTAYSARTDYIVHATYDGTDWVYVNGAQVAVARFTDKVIFTVRRWNEDPLNLGDIMVTITNL